MKRYVREEDGNIYDRLSRKYIDVKNERLIGNRCYINLEIEDEVVIFRGSNSQDGNRQTPLGPRPGYHREANKAQTLPRLDKLKQR